jgi:hypothetical protein
MKTDSIQMQDVLPDLFSDHARTSKTAHGTSRAKSTL